MDLSGLMTTETPPDERPTVAKVRAIVAAEHRALMPQRCSSPEPVSLCKRHFGTAMTRQLVAEASCSSDPGSFSEDDWLSEPEVLGSRQILSRSVRTLQLTADCRTQQHQIFFGYRR